jgi:hypothetical protein
MKKLIPLLLIVFIAALSACSSGKKAFTKGDYYDSVLKSVKRLRQNSNNSKAKTTLSEAYPMAVEYYLSQIQKSKTSSRPFKWESVLDSYQKLNRMANEIQRSPAALSIIANPNDYTREITESKENAASERYDAGRVALERGNRQDAKDAFYHFEKTHQFVPDYKDVRNQLDKAFDLATLRVLVQHLPIQQGRFAFSYDFFYNKVFEFLHDYQGNRFVRFYSPQDARNINPDYFDQVLRFRFDEFVVGETHTNSETFTVTDSVETEITLDDGKKAKGKSQVSAKYTNFRRTVVSGGTLSFEILDAKRNTILTQEKMPGEFVWESEWATYRGDKRALNKKELANTKLNEVPPPPPQQLFIEFCKPIYDQIRSKVNRYYRKK